ncbi:MAG: hypothetical protein JXQ30_11000 [Spirochaetes bacterium]|nr:hypothetical protein [Spirochaetota bacterium]
MEIRETLEKKALILKQLEGVYKTSTSLTQKKRVLKEIQEIKGVIKQLQRRYESDYGREDRESDGAEKGTSPSLMGRIPVRPYKKDSKDREMDAVVSYMRYFEHNYLPLLSEYYMKLDYSHSGKRDTFYPRFMEIMHLLKQYDYVDRSVHGGIMGYGRASSSDKKVARKGRQRYLFALDAFFKDLRGFIRILIEDYNIKGTFLLNPDDSIRLDDFEENRALNDYTVVEALEEIYMFSEEFVGFLGMPEI